MNIPAHQDTIVAIATAAGVAAIGVLRMSGPDTLAIIKKIFKGKNLRNVPSHTIHFGHIINPEQGGSIIDEVVVSVYRNPKSYTGEDTVEISGHGSPVLLGQILDVCIAQGARLAQPGEFTQRAFLNGKLDLAQAEAVADLIAAQSAAASRTALQQLRGGFSDDLATLRDQLIQFAALIELELDFSDEDVTFADRGQLTALIWTLKDKIGKLIQSFQLGNAIKEGVRIAIIGKPNAGKSTLLNALLNEERAIVSEVAGTTRDSIEELININGVHFRLIDTAGIRAHTEDLIEQHGIARSKANAEQADWILHLIDATDQDTIDEAWLEQYQDKIITIYNKIDKQPYIPSLGTSAIAISAKEKQGIEAVKDMIFQRAIGSSYHREDTIVTNARHKEALDHVYDILLQIEQGLDSGLSGDLLAIDIRRALYYLGTITGQVEVDRDILGAIFGKFCIGK